MKVVGMLLFAALIIPTELQLKLKLQSTTLKNLQLQFQVLQEQQKQVDFQYKLEKEIQEHTKQEVLKRVGGKELVEDPKSGEWIVKESK